VAPEDGNDRTDSDASEATPLDHLVGQAADLFVYAPIGLFFEAPSIVPKLARQGRTHARNARAFGEFAVRQGEAEVRRRLSGVEEHTTGLLRLFGVLPDEPPADNAPRPPADLVRTAPSPNGHVADGPDVDELAIPDYDSLSASQVVTRLDGLLADELEAVRAYEAANRGRKTILNKVAQLQA
jgi:hypothetical protein